MRQPGGAMQGLQRGSSAQVTCSSVMRKPARALRRGAAAGAARAGAAAAATTQQQQRPGVGSGVGAPAAPAAAASGRERRRRNVVAAAGADDVPAAGPFPFEPEDYHRVEFVREPFGPVAIDSAGAQWRGVLVFQLAGTPEPVTDATRVLEIFISGDACISIYTHLCPSDNTRPMALDILWQMWQRGRDISKRDWTLLRVAVVACVNDVFYGRLFFGDPETQQVLWDCDVRPSDATFLALKAKAPIFVKKSVWDACATPLRSTSTWATVNYIEAQQQQQQQQQQQMGARGAGRGRVGLGGGDKGGQQSVGPPLPAPEALPAIRLLMREMEVAVREEDYEAAARLRDHPWMRIAADIEMHSSIGYLDQAHKLFADLKGLIDAHEAAHARDYEARLTAQHEARARLDEMLRRQAARDGDGGSAAAPGGGGGVSSSSSGVSGDAEGAGVADGGGGGGEGSAGLQQNEQG